ncbi:MAG: type I phosphomannose isomerase catalytic subunit [Isosphaeraceae bacterium]|nr:type I phosphomannose isomerase catalytic subunit [Isosphaeraceae bacterium]
MSRPPLPPLRFRPILKRLIWGGRRLGTILDKPIGPESDYAESWELSDHRDDVSRIDSGPLAGCDLRGLIRDRGEELLGPALGPRSQFPLLVKFIDACRDLSVQVHPDDEKGARLANDNGKTETWVIVAAEPGSSIYAGLRPGVTRAQFREAIATGEVEPLLHRFPAVPGDAILIPAGTMHAIGAGVLLAEVQQMSDATFRVFDWNRLGPDGKPRTLHVEEALESTDFEAAPVAPIVPVARSIAGGTAEALTRSDFFALERLKLSGPSLVGSPERFTIVTALEGSCTIEWDGPATPLEFGATALLPASLGECRLVPTGTATLLTCIVP